MAKKMTEQFEQERPTQTTKKTEYSFRTGCTLLDVMIGGGVAEGSPAGRIIHYMGESASGKTFFACECIAAAHRQYKEKFHWFYDDAERGYSFEGNSRKLWGIDVRKPDDIRSTTVEELFYNVRKFLKGLKDDELGIYVVDSLDALGNDDLNEVAEERMKAGDKGQKYDKGSYGMSAQKFLSQEFFRKIAAELEEKNSLLIFLSQYRDNVNAGPYGEKRRVSGGSALKFYCDTEIALKTKEKFMKNSLHYGSCVEVELKKSKTDRPDRKALINILFDYGIDDISTNIDFIYDLKSDATGKLNTDTTCQLGDTSDPRYGTEENTLEGLKNILLNEGLYEQASGELKEAGEKRNKTTYSEWLKTNHPDTFKAYFGEPISRDELIARADKDKELRKRLKEQAIAKWEAREKEIQSGRTKYLDDDEY